MEVIPQLYDDQSRLDRARDRAKTLQQLIGLHSGMKVLEIGTGHGDVAYILAKEYNCDVVGTEIINQPSWEKINHPNLQLLELDIANQDTSQCFPDNHFDLIVSYVVWEHMRHPFSALRECARMLKPDGKKYLHAYLAGWPRLSHLAYALPEPWLHLTNSETEIKSRLGLENLPWYYYCNRLTHSHYLTYFRKLGFYVTYENIIREQFDNDYYEANERILGLYPLYDLKAHGYIVILEFDKNNPKVEIQDPVYSRCKYRSG